MRYVRCSESRERYCGPTPSGLSAGGGLRNILKSSPAAVRIKAVSVPPIPTPLDQLGPRPFSFYPPIIGIEHNEWRYLRSTWSEVQVLNSKTDSELWVPRRFLGAVSSLDEPTMIVGLSKELEYKAGTLVPHERRVIEMPRPAAASRLQVSGSEPDRQAAVVGIRLDDPAESRSGRLVLGAIAAGILACVAVVIAFRDGQMGTRVRFSAMPQSDLPFTSRDDYYSVVARLGPPAEDRWQSGAAEPHYRKLWYPQQSFALILMGSGQSARYIGALDAKGQVIHWVDLPDGHNSAALLKKLNRF